MLTYLEARDWCVQPLASTVATAARGVRTECLILLQLEMRAELRRKRRAERGRLLWPAPPLSSELLSVLRQRPKFIAPISPNDVSPPSSPMGKLMLGFKLNRELNTNPVPSVRSP